MEKKYLILRSKPNYKNKEKQFVESGLLSIGYPGVGDLEDYAESISAIKKRYPKITSQALTQIKNFVTLKKGSVVLVPSIKNREVVYIFETQSNYKYREEWDNKVYGNPHTIDAKLIRTLPRKELPYPVIRTFEGARRTVTNITKHASLMNNFLEGSQGTRNTEEPIIQKSLDAKEKELLLNQALTVAKEELSNPSPDIRLKAVECIIKGLTNKLV